MKKLVLTLTAASALACVAAITLLAMRSDRKAAEAAKAVKATQAIHDGQFPPNYRDWRLISVAREEGDLDDIRAILGNDVAVEAFRDGTLPFPDGTVIARLAWSYEESEENNKAFGRRQSFIAGHPKNGVQFMVKDSTRYASTGGWKYAHFEDGVSVVDAATLESCFDCHRPMTHRDSVFTRYSR